MPISGDDGPDPRVGFGAAFSFKYSARPGTPAAEKPPVAAEVADARLQDLQALITAQQRAAQEAMVGREVSVLYEKPGRMPGADGRQIGSPAWRSMSKTLRAESGELVRVRVLASTSNSLAAEPIFANENG
jgi:tRNA-2-methylthio-N6-dimethylallyladenosine synthase